MTQYQLTLDPTVPPRLFTSGDGPLAHLLEAILNHVLALATILCLRLFGKLSEWYTDQ